MRAYFEGSALAPLEQVFRVNFFGTLYATYHALPFVKLRPGSLVAISSLTGKRGIPSYAIYGASKFAIQGLYESLRVELRSAGVHVGVVSPGFVDTPLRGACWVRTARFGPNNRRHPFGCGRWKSASIG